MASERQEGDRSGCLLIKHSHCTVKNCSVSPTAACGERIDHTPPLGEGPSFSSPPFAFSTLQASIYVAHSFDDHGSSLCFYLRVSYKEQSVSLSVLPPPRRMMRSIGVQTEHLFNWRKQIPPGGRQDLYRKLLTFKKTKKLRKTKSASHDLIFLDRLHHRYLRQLCPESSGVCCESWVTPVVLPAGCNWACKIDKYTETSLHQALGARWRV